MKKFLLLLTAIFTTSYFVAQTPAHNKENLQTHSLLIISATQNTPDAKEQLDIVFDQREVLKRNNIMVFHITPDKVKAVFDDNIISANNYNKYVNLIDENTDFNAVLINKDNVVKFKKETPMTIEEIFEVLDLNNISTDGAEENFIEAQVKD